MSSLYISGTARFERDLVRNPERRGWFYSNWKKFELKSWLILCALILYRKGRDKIMSNTRFGTEYKILTFDILFWHSNSGGISNFDIRNPIIWNFDIRNPILTFELGAEYRILTFNPTLIFELGLNIALRYSKSYFDIRIRAEYRILTLKSYFDIRNGAEYRILTFEIYFNNRILAEYCILTFKILFWNSNWGRISHFDIRTFILTLKFGPHIPFWHKKSKFEIRFQFKCHNRISKVTIWYSARTRMSKRISNVKMRYLALIRKSKYAKFGPNSNVKIGFRMSKCDFRPS